MADHLPPVAVIEFPVSLDSSLISPISPDSSPLASPSAKDSTGYVGKVFQIASRGESGIVNDHLVILEDGPLGAEGLYKVALCSDFFPASGPTDKANYEDVSRLRGFFGYEYLCTEQTYSAALSFAKETAQQIGLVLLESANQIYHKTVVWHPPDWEPQYEKRSSAETLGLNTNLLRRRKPRRGSPREREEQYSGDIEPLPSPDLEAIAQEVDADGEKDSKTTAAAFNSEDPDN